MDHLNMYHHSGEGYHSINIDVFLYGLQSYKIMEKWNIRFEKIVCFV